MFPLVVHQPASLASSAVTPAGSVHKSKVDNVVRMLVQLKMMCVVCECYRGGIMVMDVIWCKYDLRKGDLFVPSWAMVRRVRRGSISSKLLMCGGGVRNILLLPLVTRCLETIDVYIAQSVSALDFNFERAVGGSILTAGKNVESKI